MAEESDSTLLEGRVIVVTDPDAARVVAESGATVVIVSGPDEDPSRDAVVAAALAELEAQGRRVAHYVGDLGDPDAREGLAELLSEVFEGADT